jgi:hypothetical protein
VAPSPSHQFGQIIGDALELAVAAPLGAFAEERGLYLDTKGPRPARPGLKVTWEDDAGNKHDLDFVLERGGTPAKKGTPVAFVETAWRRYTKHSRNKAQEIQGAIEPLLSKYAQVRPLGGVILAGVFTEGALEQLRSRGFAVAYLDYETVVEAFALVGIDARFGETTPDAEFDTKVRAWNALDAEQRRLVGESLVAANAYQFGQFMNRLRAVVDRTIERVVVLALHGARLEFASANEAGAFIAGYDEARICDDGFARYEVQVRFANGDTIDADFATRDSALDFLAMIAL